jgi:hypothetical protein
MGKPVPPFVTPIVGDGGLVVADPWQKYFVNLYREDDWTPVLGGTTTTAGQTYVLRGGRYLKIGRLVIASGYMALSAVGTVAGTLAVRGLPFRSEKHASGAPIWNAVVPYFQLATPWASVGGLLVPDSDMILITAVAAGGATVPTFLTVAQLTNTSLLSISLSYLAQE